MYFCGIFELTELKSSIMYFFFLLYGSENICSLSGACWEIKESLLSFL